jgi:hypothetical protein
MAKKLCANEGETVYKMTGKYVRTLNEAGALHYKTIGTGKLGSIFLPI